MASYGYGYQYFVPLTKRERAKIAKLRRKFRFW